MTGLASTMMTATATGPVPAITCQGVMSARPVACVQLPAGEQEIDRRQADPPQGQSRGADDNNPLQQDSWGPTDAGGSSGHRAFERAEMFFPSHLCFVEMPEVLHREQVKNVWRPTATARTKKPREDGDSQSKFTAEAQRGCMFEPRKYSIKNGSFKKNSSLPQSHTDNHPCLPLDAPGTTSWESPSPACGLTSTKRQGGRAPRGTRKRGLAVARVDDGRGW